MAKPRKSWEPVHRYGGSRSSFWVPAPLGEDARPGQIKVPKARKKRK